VGCYTRGEWPPDRPSGRTVRPDDKNEEDQGSGDRAFAFGVPVQDILLMSRASACVIGVLLVALAASHASAQTASDSIRSLDSAWARAYAVHDTSLAKALFADELVVTSLSGALKDKNGELADIRPQPNLQMAFFRTSDVSVRMFGRSAVVTGLAEWRFTLDGRASEFRRRYTSVYVAGGPLGWRMVALHMGRAP
jgi:ketosteroid isomerase-like protein